MLCLDTGAERATRARERRRRFTGLVHRCSAPALLRPAAGRTLEAGAGRILQSTQPRRGLAPPAREPSHPRKQMPPPLGSPRRPPPAAVHSSGERLRNDNPLTRARRDRRCCLLRPPVQRNEVPAPTCGGRQRAELHAPQHRFASTRSDRQLNGSISKHTSPARLGRAFDRALDRVRRMDNYIDDRYIGLVHPRASIRSARRPARRRTP